MIKLFQMIALVSAVVAISPILKSGYAETVPIIQHDIDVPKPLSEKDAARYQKIITLHEQKQWKKADKIIESLDDTLLLGHVMAGRYLHPTGWRSTYQQLRNWLEIHNDHPDAERIYKIAQRRKPKNAKSTKRPKKGYLWGYGKNISASNYVVIPQKSAGRIAPTKTRQIAGKIRHRIRSGWPSGALRLLDKKSLKYLTKTEEAILRADIAHGYFIYGKNRKAIQQSKQAIALDPINAPYAYFTAGLAAWRDNDEEIALNFFRQLAEMDSAPDRLIAAAAYWTSRGELRQHNIAQSYKYLDKAARFHETFYGTLANETLGQEVQVNFTLPEVKSGFIQKLNSSQSGRRIFALLQIGKTSDAAREMRYIWKELNKDEQKQAMALAAKTHMADVAFRSADIVAENEGKRYLGATYPIPDFNIEEPLKVDQALIFSIIKQESKFDPRAKSSAQASGIMQIMPATAAYITKNNSYKKNQRHDLLKPHVNITIGQDYILYLLETAIVDQDLVRLLAAYNGGPGNLQKWTKIINHQDDMLMLLESIQSRETRQYVKNVITNLWIYRKQFGQQASAIANLTAGGKATYEPSPGRGNCHVLKISHTCNRE